MLRGLRDLGLARAAAILAVSFLAIGLLGGLALLWLEPPHSIRLNIRWKNDVDPGRRAALERELRVSNGDPTEGETGTTWAYELADPSADNIRAIVQHPSVDDTAHINRVRFRPEFEQDRQRRAIYYGVLAGGFGAVAVLVWVARRRGHPGHPAGVVAGQ
jgi:hypothetical protein